MLVVRSQNVRNASIVFFSSGLLFGFILLWVCSRTLNWQHAVWPNLVVLLLIIPSPLVVSLWTGYLVAQKGGWVGRKGIANGPITGTAILACAFYLPFWAFAYIGAGGLFVLGKLFPKTLSVMFSTDNWLVHDSPILVALILAALVAAIIVALGLRRMTGRWDGQVFRCLLAAGVATVPLGYILGSLATRLSPDIIGKLPYFFSVGNSLFAVCCGVWIARSTYPSSTLVP